MGVVAFSAKGQIFVNYSNGVAEFSAYGVPINTTLVTNVSKPQGVLIDGTNLYVVNYGSNTVELFSTSGMLINSSLITNLTEPEGIAISGTNLFVANWAGWVNEYSTSGDVVTNNLIVQYDPAVGLAVSGTNLFLSGRSAINEYSTAGVPEKAPAFTTSSSAGIAISGTNVFVANIFNNTVSEYSTSGATNAAPLISGLNEPNGIAATSNLLYVLDASGTVGLYTTSGAMINPALFSVPTAGYDAFGITIDTNNILTAPPQLQASFTPPSLTLSWSTNASAYLVQTSPTLPSTNWLIVTNMPFVSNGNYNITLISTNTTQYFRLQSIN